MRKVFRLFPTYLFIFLFTLMLSNCSSNNAGLNNPPEGIIPVDNAGTSTTPSSSDSTGTLNAFPVNINTTLICADDSNCTDNQICVEGVCRIKRDTTTFKTVLSFGACKVGNHDCSENQFCHPNHPNDNIGSCQDKKIITASCDNNWECQSNYCDINQHICSPIFGDNSNTEEKKISYYLSNTAQNLHSLCTENDPSKCDINNPQFENAQYTECNNTFFPEVTNVNVIVGIKVTADENGIKDIKAACQDINQTLSNTIPPWGSSSQGLVDGYFYGKTGEFISGFWVKDSNAGQALVELQPFLTKIETLLPLKFSETLSSASWGPGNGAINAFELHCEPGSAISSIGGKKYLGYYRTLEFECRKIKTSIQNGYKENKK